MNNRESQEEALRGFAELSKGLAERKRPCRVCTQHVLKKDRGSSSHPLGGAVHVKCEGTSGFINFE